MTEERIQIFERHLDTLSGEKITVGYTVQDPSETIDVEKMSVRERAAYQLGYLSGALDTMNTISDITIFREGNEPETMSIKSLQQDLTEQ